MTLFLYNLFLLLSFPFLSVLLLAPRHRHGLRARFGFPPRPGGRAADGLVPRRLGRRGDGRRAPRGGLPGALAVRPHRRHDRDGDGPAGRPVESRVGRSHHVFSLRLSVERRMVDRPSGSLLRRSSRNGNLAQFPSSGPAAPDSRRPRQREDLGPVVPPVPEGGVLPPLHLRSSVPLLDADGTGRRADHPPGRAEGARAGRREREIRSSDGRPERKRRPPEDDR